MTKRGEEEGDEGVDGRVWEDALGRNRWRGREKREEREICQPVPAPFAADVPLQRTGGAELHNLTAPSHWQWVVVPRRAAGTRLLGSRRDACSLNGGAKFRRKSQIRAGLDFFFPILPSVIGLSASSRGTREGTLRCAPAQLSDCLSYSS